MERYQIITNSFEKLKAVYNYIAWYRFEIQDTRFYGGRNEYKFVFSADPDQFEQISKQITNNYKDVVIGKCKKL